MKTYKEWESLDPPVELDEYIKPMDEIDDELAEHIGYAIVSPNYHTKQYMQCGEAERERLGVYYYMTVKRVGNKYIYLGIYPDMNDANNRVLIGKIKTPVVTEPDTFAEGLRKLNTRGALVIPARLTKARARILMNYIDDFKHRWYADHTKPDKKGEDDMQKAMHWLVNQINKRWSQNELYSK